MNERAKTDKDARGTPAADSDLVGPGSGGSPTPADRSQDRDDTASDPDVAALVEDLRRDERVLTDDVKEAAKEAGSGTDR